ncbi:MAG: hypothetical protein LLG97_18615 [Deltaproteobacteria bacterium]|nr:hypothetical protein [Deltaproteobacteria bacterium]
MMPQVADLLVIFDYSGTLSLEAPRFGRTENLLRALAESGLADLGVSTPEIFWGEIVAPTWTAGSTTGIGYKRVMAERIVALGMGRGENGCAVTAATSRFVDSYLDHSGVDPGWRDILTELASDPAVAVVIATDHYAEATGAIVRHLGVWEIPARKAGPETVGDNRHPFVIANSADVGFWKADRCFWDALCRDPLLGKIRSLLIVDDFGFNEEQGDRYAEREKVAAREEMTRNVLREAFGATPVVIPFFLEGAERDPAGNAGPQIEETSRQIRSFLTGD